MGQFAVIGLGRFGSAASLELMRLGHSVIGVDINAKIVNQMADQLTLAAIADATDEHALKDLNITTCDAALVAIGESLEASILCVLLLKNMNVKEIWAKATSKPHHTILSRIGVSRIIHPEEEMGMRVAQSLNYPMVNQYMSIGQSLYIVEIKITEKCQSISIEELLREAKDSIDPLLVRRKKDIFKLIKLNFVLEAGDSLVLAGSLSALKTIAPRLV
ncbi:TrkA family potassium uptake protein [Nitrosomonas sp. Nm166]|uniref:potassium channel family protein n=1 Tax=Nitrosomonas sp. Nm166 TaxID=1881054 RepID=UPI0008E37C4F|nr:TrkA family potassium uptake protein [Nitrosomonas sp. Nm166]SFD89364.1 trk system potassium uptake protein TrkA [Nitrosomonas sp. Nm166]